MSKFRIGNIVFIRERSSDGSSVLKKCQLIFTDLVDENGGVSNEAEFTKVIDESRCYMDERPDVEGIIFQSDQ
jgi:hypothetical protein